MKEAVPLPEEASVFPNFEPNSRRRGRIGWLSEGADDEGGRESDRIHDRLRQRVSQRTHEDRCCLKRSVSFRCRGWVLDWVKRWTG